MNQDLRWFAVAREDLIDVLLGEEGPRGIGSPTPPDIEYQPGMIALGYKAKLRHSGGREFPAIVALDDRSAIETFSWLRVYSEDAFPISQFARVVLQSDWKVFGQFDELPRDFFRPERWASVAVGETLAQADSEVDLQSMALSRVASSLSLPVGRTASIFGNGEPTRVCVDRLRAITEDSRFGRRNIGVEELTPIWALCGASVDEHIDPSEAADVVLAACNSHLRDHSSSTSWNSEDFLGAFPRLRSDSIEQRVVAFNELAQEVSRLSPALIAGLGAAALAAGCFLVGRGTSHAFLLSRYQRVAPSAFAWFGLMAAFAGPRSWDRAWLRAVKGAERLLRSEFTWGDAPSADIGWGEFSWLAGTFDDAEHLASLPKMLPRTLGVEVVPGVVLQVRLGHGASEEVRAVPQASSNERQLSATLSQILDLALRATGHNPRIKSDVSQQSLDLEDSRTSPSTGKPARPKRGKRGTDEH